MRGRLSYLAVPLTSCSHNTAKDSALSLLGQVTAPPARPGRAHAAKSERLFGGSRKDGKTGANVQRGRSKGSGREQRASAVLFHVCSNVAAVSAW